MCTPRLLTSVLIASALLAAPAPSSAWGFEAHRYIMSRAIPLLPAEIRGFFERYRTAIVEHAIDPDLWRNAGWEVEPPRHYLDLDAYGPYPFSALPRDYDEAVKKYGAEFLAKNGLVPWRTAEIYGKLVEAFTQKAGYSRENIKFFSSVLAHYVSDAHVPFHAALNHDGQLTGQWGIHSRFESELFERYLPRLRVEPRPVGPTPPARDLIFDTLLAGFPLTAPILEADKAAAAGRDVYDDAYFDEFFRKVQPMLERRLAEAITASASLITAAWIDAGRPGLPVEQPRAPRPVRRQ
jgi:hypothetical protein